MHTFVAAGAAFLLAVPWFDLMFDVQARAAPGTPLPADVLTSISVDYRRVTIDAFPMNRAVALVMLLTLGTLIAEIVQGVHLWWVAWLLPGAGQQWHRPPPQPYGSKRTAPWQRKGHTRRAVIPRPDDLSRSRHELRAHHGSAVTAVDRSLDRSPGWTG